MSSFGAILRLARPKQWVKNLFVFTALIFAGKALDTEAMVQALIAFGAFCLASSSIYFINDYKDIEEDRRHPVKKARPLASGALPPTAGPLGFIVLAAAGLGLALLLNRWAAVTVGLYLAINLGYSLGLKHVVILDVLLIASGFVLRILAGAAAISVLPSTWLILCATTLSLFLGFTKRRAEVMLLNEKAGEHRKVLRHYSLPFLDQMIAIVTASTVVLYILYTVDARTVELVGSRAMLLSVPLVLYGIFRYLYLVYHDARGGDPTRTVFTDVPILVTGGLWGVLCMLVILFGKRWIVGLF